MYRIVEIYPPNKKYENFTFCNKKRKKTNTRRNNKRTKETETFAMKIEKRGNEEIGMSRHELQAVAYGARGRKYSCIMEYKTVQLKLNKLQNRNKKMCYLFG